MKIDYNDASVLVRVLTDSTVHETLRSQNQVIDVKQVLEVLFGKEVADKVIVSHPFAGVTK